MVANKIVICISVLISTSCAQMNVGDKLEETQVTLKWLGVDRKYYFFVFVVMEYF